MGFESKEENNKLKILVDAIIRSGKRGIIQGFSQSLQTYQLPDNIINIGSVPHEWLFPQAFCIIHHGGLSTTATVFKAGVPAIVIPHVLDQYIWANKAYQLQTGAKPVKPKDLNQEVLMDRIEYISNNYDEIEKHTRKISQLINKEQGLKNAIDLIGEVKSGS
ncbi:MAG: nucleotide disphospho-sugar-binding domain-containing protein [Halanaerobium sp.]|nr:nucleotide disphospho-sugar-binding domain-containing protein [Halanaerobium sp.]